MNPQTAQQIAQLEAQIATIKASAVVTDIEHGLKAYVPAKEGTKARAEAEETLYKACKSFCNHVEKRKRSEAKPEEKPKA